MICFIKMGERISLLSFLLIFTSAARPVSSIPRFSVRLMNQTVQEGMPVTFTVDVNGFPVPSLNWQKDGQTIKNDPRYNIWSDGGKSTLSISSVLQDDNSWFQCTAVNIAGTASSRLRLTVVPSKMINLDFSIHISCIMNY